MTNQKFLCCHVYRSMHLIFFHWNSHFVENNSPLDCPHHISRGLRYNRPTVFLYLIVLIVCRCLLGSVLTWRYTYLVMLYTTVLIWRIRVVPQQFYGKILTTSIFLDLSISCAYWLMPVICSGETGDMSQGRSVWFYLYGTWNQYTQCIQPGRTLPISTSSLTKAHTALLLCVHEWFL